MLYFQLLPYTLTLVYIIWVFLKISSQILLSYKNSNFIFFKSFFNKNNINGLVFFLFITLIFFIVFIARGVNCSTTNFTLSNSNQFICLNWLVVSSLIYMFLNKNNIFFSLIFVLYCLFFCFLIYSNNMLVTYLFIELTTYTNILMLLLLAVFSDFFSKKNKLYNSVFLVLIFNFFFSFFFVSFIISYTYVYGVWSWSTLSWFSMDTLYLLLMFSFLLKLSFGPWYLWNLNIYLNMPLIILVLYISGMFLVIIPYIFQILVVLPTTYYIKIFFLLVILFSIKMVNSQIFLVKNIKSFFLFSSYISYINILFLLIVY